MQGAWGNFWVRTVTTVLVAAIAGYVFGALPFAQIVLGGWLVGPGGVLDFAGGSVVHITPWLSILPFWIAAEAKALRTKRPLPFGCYLIFIAVTIFCMSWLPLLMLVHMPMGSKTLPGGTEVASIAAAFILAATYYSLSYRRSIKSNATDAF
jgi:hypothetical protein